MASNEPPLSPNEPQLSPAEIAELDSTLSEFRDALALPQRDEGRRNAAQRMRRAGFSVTEIQHLSGGRWKESTIKRHVSNVTVAINAPAPRAIALINQALDQQLTLQTILEFLPIQTVLTANQVTVRDIADLLKTLADQKIPVSEFVAYYQKIVEAKLIPTNLKTVIDYKAELEDIGFGLNDLTLISDTAKGFGKTPVEVLKAISKYGEVTKLEAELTDLQKKNTDTTNQLTKTQDDVKEAESKLGGLKKEIESASDTLKGLTEVTDRGYDKETLQNLSTVTISMGGVKDVFAALEDFKGLVELRKQIQNAEEKAAKLKKDNMEMETKNLHFKGHIEAVHALTETDKLTLDAIESILRIAKKHGEPQSVLKAFEEYDTLQQLKDEQHKVEGDVADKKNTLQQLEAQEKLARSNIDKLLPELEKKTVALTGAFEKSFTNLTDTVKGDIEAVANQVKAELKNVLDAGHALDAEYDLRERKGEKVKAFMELLSLVENPSNVTDPRIMATSQLIISQLGEWLKTNEKKFDRHPSFLISPILAADACRSLVKHLNELGGVFRGESAG